MSQREEGKFNASRIGLDYHRQRTWLGIGRWIAVCSALLVSGSYTAWVLWMDGVASSASSHMRSLHLSTGQLAQVHASVENDCARCHADVVKWDSGAIMATNPWTAEDTSRLNLFEEKCLKCHAAQAHFRDKLANINLDRDCAACHRDHQGRHQLLTSVSNGACTQCHANLTSACKAGATTTLKSAIESFSLASHNVSGNNGSSADAATFRSLQNDPGRIRFDHAQHMQPGQVEAPIKGGFQVSMLPGEMQKRYATVQQDDVSLVLLSCADCHQPLKIKDTQNPNSISTQEGRYYAPIDFEDHCGACHQLTFAGQKPDHLPLPHAAMSGEYKRLLQANLVGGVLQGQIENASNLVRTQEEQLRQRDTDRPIELVQVKIEAGVAAIRKRCEQCHQPDDITEDKVEAALAGKGAPLIPQRWLQFGAFNHASHANISNCQFCHPGTDGKPPSPSADSPVQTGATLLPSVNQPTDNANDHHVVRIRGVESCVPCHRDSKTADHSELDTPEKRQDKLGKADQPIWASDKCTTCHRYHWTRPQGDQRGVVQ